MNGIRILKEPIVKIQIKCICAILLLIAVVFSKCAGRPAKKTPEQPYVAGVIDSANYGTTYLYLLDENLKKTDTLKCPYYGVGSFGSTPVQIQDGVLYEKWSGNTVMPSKCAVAAMELQTGEWSEYSFEGGIIGDFRVNEKGIFVLKNAKEPSVEYSSFAGGESVSIKLEVWPGLSISVNGYDVYFIANEGTYQEGGEEAQEKCFLYRVNVKDQSQEKVLDVTEELGENILEYTLWWDGKMYIPNNDKLCIYEPKTNQVRQIALPGKEACKILADGERLYIINGYTNENETDIYCFNPQTEEIESSCHIKESTLQCYIREGIFYTLQQEPVAKVCKYQFAEDGTCKKLSEAVLDAENDDGHIISDMFVK